MFSFFYSKRQNREQPRETEEEKMEEARIMYDDEEQKGLGSFKGTSLLLRCATITTSTTTTSLLTIYYYYYHLQPPNCLIFLPKHCSFMYLLWDLM